MDRATPAPQGTPAEIHQLTMALIRTHVRHNRLKAGRP